MLDGIEYLPYHPLKRVTISPIRIPADRMKQTVENRWHFGIPVFEARLDDFDSHRQALRTKILAMMENDAGMQRSNHGGWHSGDTLHRSADESWQWLTRSLSELAVACIRHAEGPDYRGEVLLSALWANVNPTGAWNAPHVHLPCEWSGVVYVAVNENPVQRGAGARDGDIMFFDPLPAGTQYRRPPTVAYPPKNGLMYLFPGYLLHMVAPHFEAEPRISVSFNFRLSEQVEGIAR